MTRYVPVETPGGKVWAEIEEADTEGIVLVTAYEDALKSFQEATNALKTNAAFLLESMATLAPQDIEVSFGIKVGVEAGTPFFGLAKASGEGSYTVTLKWKATGATSAPNTVNPK
jgi:hypothetical protein